MRYESRSATSDVSRVLGKERKTSMSRSPSVHTWQTTSGQPMNTQPDGTTKKHPTLTTHQDIAAWHLRVFGRDRVAGSGGEDRCIVLAQGFHRVCGVEIVPVARHIAPEQRIICDIGPGTDPHSVQVVHSVGPVGVEWGACTHSIAWQEVGGCRRLTSPRKGYASFHSAKPKLYKSQGIGLQR